MIFTLRDNDRKHATEVQVRVEAANGFLSIYPEGYGEPNAADGNGAPVLLEVYKGHLRLIYSPDITEEGARQIVDLEGARESLRPQS